MSHRSGSPRGGVTQRLGTMIQLALGLVLLSYALDWAIFHMRQTTRTVQVDQFLSTPLKGNKAEYDYMGTVAKTCSVTLYPQSGNQPCWWLEKHRTEWEK